MTSHDLHKSLLACEALWTSCSYR